MRAEGDETGLENLRRRIHFVFFAGGLLHRFALATAEHEQQGDEQNENGARYD